MPFLKRGAVRAPSPIESSLIFKWSILRNTVSTNIFLAKMEKVTSCLPRVLKCFRQWKYQSVIFRITERDNNFRSVTIWPPQTVDTYRPCIKRNPRKRIGKFTFPSPKLHLYFQSRAESGQLPTDRHNLRFRVLHRIARYTH